MGGDAESGYRSLQGTDPATLSGSEWGYSAGVPPKQLRQADTYLQGRRLEGCKVCLELLAVLAAIPDCRRPTGRTVEGLLSTRPALQRVFDFRHSGRSPQSGIPLPLLRRLLPCCHASLE